VRPAATGVRRVVVTRRGCRSGRTTVRTVARR